MTLQIFNRKLDLFNLIYDKEMFFLGGEKQPCNKHFRAVVLGLNLILIIAFDLSSVSISTP